MTVAPTFTAVLKPVGAHARAIEVTPTLEAYRELLGNAFMLDMRDCGDFAFWVDDLGLVTPLPFNVRLGNWNLHGPVLFVGPTGPEGEETDLPAHVARRLLAWLNEGVPLADLL